jgi:uncharacterized membrane protein YkvA (DUF1232 family)
VPDVPQTPGVSGHVAERRGQDPFPRDEFTALLRHLPAYARLAWTLARDPRLSRARRLAVLAGAAYVLSPIDLVPGFIPVAGQLDDVAVALGAIRLALNGLKPEFRAATLAAAHLTQADLDSDLRTTGAIAGWMARSGLRVTRRAASTALDIGGRLFRRTRRALSKP